MAFVQRANVVLEIKDDQVERFLDQGYDVIDEAGNILQKSVPQDIGTLRKAYVEHIEEIKQLKGQIKKLQSSKSPSSRKSTTKKEQ